MSVNYASGLSEFPDKGVCGLPEKFDLESDVEEKSLTLAKWIEEAKGLVAVHTGAGISTACGIPDFRGPRGVWTLEQKDEKPTFNLSFEDARPSLTHMALVALERAGFINAIITQNVDGLHLRSGFPRNRIAILHGDMFMEECELCRTLYQRDSPAATVGLKRSGTRCKMSRRFGRGRCRGYLRDTILDWEDQLPDEDLDFARIHSEKANLSICLGTSLQIVPGGELPLLTKKKNKKQAAGDSANGAVPGRIAIVNLQPTKRDRNADLKIHGFVDKVMTIVCKYLNVKIPDFVTPALVTQSHHTSSEERQRWVVIPSEKVKTLPDSSPADVPVKRKLDDSWEIKTKCAKVETDASETKECDAPVPVHNSSPSPNACDNDEHVMKKEEVCDNDA